MGISELRRLPGDSLDHARMLMSETGNGGAAGAIEDPAAILGNQPHAVAADGPGRCFAQVSMQHAAVAGAHESQPFSAKWFRQVASAQRRKRPRDPLAARQSVLVDSLVRHLPGSDLPARKGVCELRAVGSLECDLDRSRQSDRRLPGDPRSRRLLGRHPREVSLHSVRHLSLRSAVAARACDPDLHCAVLRVEPAQLLAQGAHCWCGPQRWS